MVHYRPILKAKPGEFEAVGTLDPGVAAVTTPIFEWCPDPLVLKGVNAALQKAQKYLPAGLAVGVDVGFLPHTASGTDIPLHVATELQSNGIPMLPVVRAADGAPLLASQAAAIGMHLGEAVLRIDAAGPLPTAAQVGSLGAALGLGTGQLHLLLDSGAVSATSPTQASTIAGHLGQLGGLGPWASVTWAAGAFPASISNLAVGAVHTLERHDAALWRLLGAAGQVVDFADYAVNHPAFASGGRGPLPNLRYTAGRDWLVWREAKNRPGNESFYDLCKGVIQHASWPGAAFSWGDARIAAKAAETEGAGTATQWRAYGTSHHVTTVVDRLAILGEP